VVSIPSSCFGDLELYLDPEATLSDWGFYGSKSNSRYQPSDLRIAEPVVANLIG
jgi:hypothetical protein